MRRFPLVGGIDVAGTVESSADRALQGGRSRCWSPDTTSAWRTTAATPRTSACRRTGSCRCRRDCRLFDAMAIGTAGFTAALSIVEMERNGLAPRNGPVIVTGATGGVGSIGGAVSGGARLRGDGAHRQGAARTTTCDRWARADVLSRATLQMGTRPLEKATWAGAVDPVGGDDARVADADDDVQRLHRELGPDRRHRAEHDGAAVHPARRQAARHRLGDVSDAGRGSRSGAGSRRI